MSAADGNTFKATMAVPLTEDVTVEGIRAPISPSK